jgi:hypothetical protein
LGQYKARTALVLYMNLPRIVGRWIGRVGSSLSGLLVVEWFLVCLIRGLLIIQVVVQNISKPDQDIPVPSFNLRRGNSLVD